MGMADLHRRRSIETEVVNIDVIQEHLKKIEEAGPLTEYQYAMTSCLQKNGSGAEVLNRFSRACAAIDTHL